MTEIDRIGRKTRRHVYVSAEFDGATDQLLPGHVVFSKWAEAALWEKLLEEFGEDAVLEAVEQAQRDMTEEDLLPEHDREQYELPA